MTRELVEELHSLLTDARDVARPGDVHSRADGDYEKQRDGTWRRLPRGHGKQVTRAVGVAARVKVPTKATAVAPRRASETFARVLGVTSTNVQDTRHPATIKGVGWVPGAGPWKAQAEGLPSSTWKAHFDTDPESPTFNTPISDERRALHARIYDAFLGPTPRVPDDQQPVAIVTMGLPASGKSSAIQALSIDASQFVPADSDLVKNYLPEFQEGLNQRAKNAADIVHDESAYLVEQMREKAIRERKCLIADGTGSNFEVWEKLIGDLKKNGYRVHLLMADLSPDKCKERISERAERTGRYVPHERVDGLAPKLPKNFLKLKDLSDTAMLFSTENGEPVPVYTRIDDAPEDVFDRGAYAEFKRRAGVSEAALVALGVARTLREVDMPVVPTAGRRQAPFMHDDAVWVAVTMGYASEQEVYSAIPVRFKRGEGVDMLPRGADTP